VQCSFHTLTLCPILGRNWFLRRGRLHPGQKVCTGPKPIQFCAGIGSSGEGACILNKKVCIGRKPVVVLEMPRAELIPNATSYRHRQQNVYITHAVVCTGVGLLLHRTRAFSCQNKKHAWFPCFFLGLPSLKCPPGCCTGPRLLENDSPMEQVQSQLCPTSRTLTKRSQRPRPSLRVDSMP
jgi:hypothetical protein